MPASIGEMTLPYRSPHFVSVRTAVRHCPCPPGPIVVGLSGGADSLALLAAARAEGRAVTALCIDHGLQPGSAAVAETAANLARTMGADASVVAVDIPTSSNLEAAARTARYQAFVEHAAGLPVWLGHTMDDQAETYLLGAVRGKATGMLPHSRFETLDIYRPLLSVRRADTTAACAELGLKPWQDPHNGNPDFLRVRLRQLLRDNLGGTTPGDPIPALAQAAGAVAEDNAALQQLAEAAYQAAHTAPATEAATTLDCRTLATYPPAIRRRVIATWLRDNGAQVTAAGVGGVDKLVVSYTGQGAVAVKRATPLPQGKVFGVPPRLVVRRVSGMLKVESVSTSP